MLIRLASRGFTLVELLVTITIAAILMMLALPSMSAYFANAKIGSAARSLQAGLQTARAEAIHRNLPVEFLLTDTAIGPTIATKAVPSATGANWVVRFNDTTQATAVQTLIEAKAALESSGQAAGATPSIKVTSSVPTGSPAFAGSIFFDGLGATTPTGSAVILDVSNPAGGACASADGTGGPMRCLTVKALAGGQVLVCDPLAAASDSRAC